MVNSGSTMSSMMTGRFDGEDEFDIRDYVAVFLRRKYQFFFVVTTLLITALAVVMLIPAEYKSSATILIERQEIPSDLVRTTVTSYADQRIQVISQRVMTSGNLVSLIEKYDLYSTIRDKESINVAVVRMRENIDLNMISADVVDPQSGRTQEATIAFSLSFVDKSAAIAQKITNELVSLFLNENLARRAEAANEASSFLEAEANEFRNRINSIDVRLTKFKEQNSQTLPELNALNRELMLKTEERIRDNAQAVRVQKQQIVYLQAQLAQLIESRSADAVPKNALQARLYDLEGQVVEVRQKYSSLHPKRIQLENELTALRRQVAVPGDASLTEEIYELQIQLEQVAQKYSPEHPDYRRLTARLADLQRRQKIITGSSDSSFEYQNPAVVQISAQLESARLELDSLNEIQEDLLVSQNKYEELLLAAPRVEQEYKALLLDYDNATRKYNELNEKQLQARLAQSLEKNRKSERFLLVEPPLLPEKPFKPNRFLLAVLALFFAAAAGVAYLVIADQLDSRIYGEEDIVKLTKIPFLVGVPLHAPFLAAAKGNPLIKRHWNSLLVFIGFLICMLLVVVFLPLDVFYFRLLRKVELFFQ